jgi:hypothetical protein
MCGDIASIGVVILLLLPVIYVIRDTGSRHIGACINRVMCGDIAFMGVVILLLLPIVYVIRGRWTSVTGVVVPIMVLLVVVPLVPLSSLPVTVAL